MCEAKTRSENVKTSSDDTLKDAEDVSVDHDDGIHSQRNGGVG